MVFHRKDMKVEKTERRYDGEGVVQYTHFMDMGPEKRVKVLSEIVLNPGCSIGYHRHDSDTHFYLVVSGTGTANDDGREVQISAGDVTVTENGASHSIKNNGSEPLVLHSIIVAY